MGRKLYDTQPLFRASLEHCDAILRPHIGRSLMDVLYPRPVDEAEARSELEQTRISQPAIFAVEWSLAELWRSWGVQPSLVLGHSVGEYVAACVAGVFDLEDALALIAARGRLMQTTPAGAMAAVFTDRARIDQAIEPYAETVAVAAINGPKNIVISGAAREVEAIRGCLLAAGIQSIPLPVSHAFHSPLVEPVLDEFERVAARVVHREPRNTFISNLTATAAYGRDLGASYWRRHARQPVRFADSLGAARTLGYHIFVEIGPTPVLSGLAARCLPDSDVKLLPSLRRGQADWTVMLQSLAALYLGGVRIDWEGFDRGYGRRRLVLPSYPFQRRRFWFREIDPGQSIAAPQPARGGADDRDADNPMYITRWVPDVESAEIWKKTGTIAANPLKHGTDRLLLFADRGGLAAQLARLLEASGRRVVLVTPGDEYRSIDGSHYEIDSSFPADYDRLFREFAGENSLADWSVVHLWSLDQALALDGSVADLTEAHALGCRSVLYLAQTLARRVGAIAPRLWLVTRGVQAVGSESAPARVAAAPIWGLAKVIGLEHPEFRCVRVDLDPADGSDEVNLLRHEIDLAAVEPQVAFRQGRRHVARLAALGSRPVAAHPLAQVESTPDATALVPLRFPGDGTYLITGGLTGLGFRVGQWLVERGARNLLLIGRREPAAPVREIIAEWRHSGANALVVAADVSREPDLRRALALAADSLPPIRGVIHAAGVMEENAVLATQDWERVARVRAKVEGSWLLHRLTRSIPLDFFVMFSSAATVLGVRGQADYAAANAFLDGLAHHRRALGLRAEHQLGRVGGGRSRRPKGSRGPVRPSWAEQLLDRGRLGVTRTDAAARLRPGNVRVGQLDAVCRHPGGLFRTTILRGDPR